MEVEHWVDWSKWQGRVGRERMLRMKADGIVGVIVGSWHGVDANRHVEADLRDARELELGTGTYIVANRRSAIRAVHLGREACGDEWAHCLFAWADVEVDGANEEGVWDMMAEIGVLGLPTGVYTGNWFWDRWMRQLGRYPDFSTEVSWLASYNGRAVLDVTPRPGLGPVVAKQYRGSTPAYGTTVDFNVFDSAYIASLRKEPVMGAIKDAFTKAGQLVEEALDRQAPVPGQPVVVHDPPVAAPQRFHTVVRGDRAGDIAAAHGITLTKLKRLNPGKPRSGNWNIIDVDEVFRVA